MARIRTIKPEFFTSEDIVALSPMARLLYISTWCEADKEGRLLWKPGTFKLRYFPGDACDIEAMCAELVNQGLVVLYGDGMAYIPGFAKHQHINPRESASSLPVPPKSDESQRVTTRQHASIPDVTHREEGKGREGKGKNLLPTVEGSGPALRTKPPTAPLVFDGTNADDMNGKAIAPIAANFTLPETWGLDAEALGFKPADVLREGEKFRQYWTAGRGAGTRRSAKGWRQTWSNWLEKAAKDSR